MQFQSAVKRKFIIAILLGFVPDIFLAAGAAAIFHGGLMGFVLTFLGIQLLPFPIWVMRSIFSWIQFSVYRKREMANTLLEHLKKHKFPCPQESEESAENYFERVLNDESLSTNLRLAAAGEYMSFSAMRNLGIMQQLLMTSFAYELALEDYSKHLAATGPTNT